MADIICSDSTDSDLLEEFTTSDLKIGDVVAIKTMTLFNNRKYMFEMLCYNIRGSVFGVIKNIYHDSSYFSYQVDWAIHGLFDISEEFEDTKNSVILERSHLKLVRSNKDYEYRGDSYIEEYFFHDGKHWRLLNLRTKQYMACELCDCEDIIMGTTTGCQRSNWRVRHPMTQLMLDLNARANVNMTNSQRRYACYKWYTRLAHNEILRDIDTRSICPCYEIEINDRFDDTTDDTMQEDTIHSHD